MNSSLRLAYLIAIVLCLSTSNLFGKILNGYESQLGNNKTALQMLRLRIAAEKNLSQAQRHSIKSEMADAIDYIALYELTEELIYQLKVISLSIFHESDTIKDRKGRLTDIYVKLIPREKSEGPVKCSKFHRTGAIGQGFEYFNVRHIFSVN